MKKQAVLFLLAIFALGSVKAQTVDTIEVFSPKMNRSIKNVIILPDGYKKDGTVKYPVLYLLHGYSGRYDSWVSLKSLLSGFLLSTFSFAFWYLFSISSFFSETEADFFLLLSIIFIFFLAISSPYYRILA